MSALFDLVLEYITLANHTTRNRNPHKHFVSTCFGKWTVHQLQVEVVNSEFNPDIKLDKWHSFLHSMAAQ